MSGAISTKTRLGGNSTAKIKLGEEEQKKNKGWIGMECRIAD